MDGDLYGVLGVAVDASPEEVTAAWRRRVRETHPDVGGDPEVFRRVSTAGVVLRDPEARQRYDETGETPEGVDETLGAALGMLSELVQQWLASDDESVQPGQLADALAISLRMGLGGMRSQLQAMQGKQKRAERHRKKSSGNKRLAQLLAAKVRELDSACLAISRRIAAAELAVRMMTGEEE